MEDSLIGFARRRAAHSHISTLHSFWQLQTKA